MSTATESPSAASESPSATEKKSPYEAWKQLVMDADAEGVELWTEELSEASGPLYRRQGALDGNGLAPLLISVGLLLASAIVLIPKFRHITQGEWSVGIVVGHQKFGYGASGSIRAPVIRYSAPGGVFDKVADLPAAEATYPVGKEVWVLFVRGEPGNAVVADFVQLFMIPTVVGFLGLICLSGTAVYLIWHVRPELATKASAETRRQLAAALATGDKQDSNDAEGGPTMNAAETTHAANMSQPNGAAAHSAASDDVAPPRDAAGYNQDISTKPEREPDYIAENGIRFIVTTQGGYWGWECTRCWQKGSTNHEEGSQGEPAVKLLASWHSRECAGFTETPTP